MKALFLSNPLDELSPAEDTSIGFMAEAFDRGWQCFWTWSEQVHWRGFNVQVDAKRVEGAKLSELPTLGEKQSFQITDFDIVFIRKNPPFDEPYLRLCWVLAPFESRVRFVNKPSLLLRYHEKMPQLDAFTSGYLDEENLISTCITDDLHQAVEYVHSLESEDVVIKPWLGYGGRKIHRHGRHSFIEEAGKLFDGKEAWMIQPFCQEIYDVGDRRVIFARGNYMGDFVRLPKEGDFVSNLSQGGRAVLKELNEAERAVVERLEKWLKREQIDFAGADLIGHRVNEINITSPTGAVTLQKLDSTKMIAKELLDSF